MDATATKLLDVRDLSVAFRQGEREMLAVDRVSFDIARGETVALVGESGSGKSVTALSILKLLPYPAARHPSGAIHFKGQELLGLPEREIRHVRGNDITIIFQEPMTSLNPLHTIEKQIGEILDLHRGLSGEPARARIIELLGQVGIPDPASRVTVTVTENEKPPHRVMTLEEIFASRRPPFRSAEEIVANIRR
ncbi:MAG: ATP-binding cassette domain-containing protein, partial [Xanthobacteraceae bacterium]